VRRVVELTQSAPGALVHDTPAHGSAAQAPLAQPKLQAESLLL
jgi:hypothetical protein